jgi:hypothetical protein
MILIDYANKHWNSRYLSPNGTNLWRQAAANNILPGRSDQAMEGRWKKHIRPNWAAFRNLYREYSGLSDFDFTPATESR